MKQQIFAIVRPESDSLEGKFSAEGVLEKQIQYFLQVINPQNTNLRIGLLTTALSYNARIAGELEKYLELFTRNGVIAFEIVDYAFDSDIFHLVDAIYVLGDLTKKALNFWESLKINQRLKEAHQTGIPLAGDGTGALCWFEYICSPSECGRTGCQSHRACALSELPANVQIPPDSDLVSTLGSSESDTPTYSPALGILPGILVKNFVLNESAPPEDMQGPIYSACDGEVFHFVGGELYQRAQIS